MAITYVSNSLITQGNFPLDARTVTTFDQMPSIEYPFVGMQVYVTEEKTTYLINADCLTEITEAGKKYTVFKNVDELRKHCVKITTSDNILEMIDGSAIIGPSGNSVIKRYCLGTKDAPNYSYDRMTLENSGWEINRPSITDEFGFVWSIEAIVTNNNTELVAPGWSETPLRENGEPGVQGVKGDPGLPGETTTVAYLDNPMDSVLLDADNNVTSGFPCSTNFYVYQGTESLKVTNLAWTASEELASDSVNVSYSDTYATLTVKKLPTSSSAKVSFTLTATVNGVEYKAIYLINKISASAPNIVIDMANDNINIPCDSNGTILDGVLPLSVAINAFKAGESIVVTSATPTTPGVTCSLSDNTITISQLPNFTNSLNIDLNVTLEDGTNRVVSFRIIKVVPGAPGEAAEFWEIGTESSIIKVNSSNEIINTPFKVYLLHREGLSTTKVELGDSSIPSNMKLYYSIDNDNLTNEMTSGTIDLSNAIMGALDLDRYLSLSLVLNGEIIDGPERIYMVKDGEQGPQGPQGIQGIQGPSGADGESNYFHIAYANDASGNGYNQDRGDYVSTYVDSEINDVQSKFNAAGWRLFKGEQGEKGERGIAGAKGADGKTYYLHIAYANSEDGSVDFSVGVSAGRSYIGTYADNIEQDSNDYHAYDWKKYVGDAAVIYRLVANNHTIKKDNVNGLKNSDPITVSILRIDGETSSTITLAQLSQYTGDAYDIYKYTDSSSVQVTSDTQLIISTTEMEGVNDYIRYQLVNTQTGSDNPDIIDSVTIDVLYDGPAGADGRIMYYDGEWESGKLYEADDTSTPYIYDKTGPEGYNYFFLVRDRYDGTVSPYNDWHTNNASDQHSWKPIPKFEAMYANVGMFDTATVGPAVFYGDYVFSQTSTTNGTNFKDFTVKSDGTIDTSKFNPAIWFNFKTGEGSLAKGNISWDKSGDVTFSPNVKLSWSSITDAPSIDGGLSESDVKRIFKTTTISKDQIETGTITADKINTDNLSVKAVNTIPDSTDGTGNIIIQDNSITVNELTKDNSADYARPVLTVHGDNMLNLSEILQKKTVNCGSCGSASDDNGQVFYKPDYAIVKKIGDVVLNGDCNWLITTKLRDGNNLTMTDPYLHYTLQSATPQNAVMTSLYVYYDICIVPSTVSVTDLTYWENAYTYKIDLNSESITTKTGVISPTNPSGLIVNQGPKGHIWSSTIANGTYAIYERFSIKQILSIGEGINAAFTLGTSNQSGMFLDIEFVPNKNVKMTEVASDGLRVSYDSDKYFVTNGDSFIMRNGNNAIGLNSNGIWIALGENKYSGLSMTGTTGNYTMRFATKSTVTSSDLIL